MKCFTCEPAVAVASARRAALAGALVETRKGLIYERGRRANRLHKVLEDAGIKLTSVANDVLGVSGRAMLAALVATDPRSRLRVAGRLRISTWGAVHHQHGGCLRAQFLRLRSRRGPKGAIVAVAASILTAAYHVLRDDVEYRDLGADYFDRRDKAKVAKRLIARLHDFGLSVEVRAA